MLMERRHAAFSCNSTIANFDVRPIAANTYSFPCSVLASAGQIEPRSATFRESLTQGRHFAEQDLWGKPLLVVP